MGVAGTLACIAIFVYDPSFPTPDKLLVFLVFVFMVFGQTIAMLKRLLPFIVLLLVYESFRGFADQINSHVNYTLAPHIDKLLFGNLPIIDFQNWLWHGHVQWYDFALYLPYMLFFILPLSLAILVWKTRDHYYWRVVTSYMFLFSGGFLTFLFFPAAPPWLASDGGYIPHIQRISSDVWYGLGIHDFPSLYNHLSPNPVAAVPSLHAGCATLFSIIIFKIYGRRWGILSLIYPAAIYFGVIYLGEHYAFDVILGIVYGIAAYVLTPHLMRVGRRVARALVSRLRPTTHKAVQ